MTECLQLSELICQIDRQFAANSGYSLSPIALRFAVISSSDLTDSRHLNERFFDIP
jgi:hypothetical protein